MKKFFIFTFLSVVMTMGLICNAKPKSVGLVEGRLQKCPDKPNCVCSLSDPKDEEHFIKPIDIEVNPILIVKKVFIEHGLKIVSESPNYIHATHTSFIFRFVDDVEAHFDESYGKLHFRSASRTGYSDLGVNRRRVDSLIYDLKRKLAKIN